MKINKIDLILIRLTLFVPVIFDFLYGYLNEYMGIDVRISALYRSILLIIMIFYTSNKFRSNMYFYAFLLIFSFFISALFWTVNGTNHNFFREIQQFSRTLFTFVSVIFLGKLLEKYHNSEKLVLIFLHQIALAGLIIALLITISFFSGFGIKTYGEYSYAVTSFFNAQNDITLSLLIAMSSSIYLFFKESKTKYLAFSIAILLGLFILGTRAGSLGAVGIVFGYILFVVIYGRRVKVSRFVKTSFIILFIGLFIFFIPKVIQVISEYNYLEKKYSRLFDETPRARLEKVAMSFIEHRNVSEDFFGNGTIFFGKKVGLNYIGRENEYGKLVEQDLLDLWGSYGYILGGLILFFPVYLFFKAFNILKKTKSIDAFYFFFSILIYLTHAFLAGHAINSPTVAGFISVIFIFTLRYDAIKFFQKIFPF